MHFWLEYGHHLFELHTSKHTCVKVYEYHINYYPKWKILLYTHTQLHTPYALPLEIIFLKHNFYFN